MVSASVPVVRKQGVLKKILSDYKHEEPHQKEKRWKCFGCFHVHTCSTLIALWHFTLQFLAVIFMLVVMMNPNIDTDDPFMRSESIMVHTWSIVEGYWMWMCLLLGSFVITLVMIYGLVKQKASLLMPFLFIQFADAFFTAGVFVTYFLSFFPAGDILNRIVWMPFHHIYSHYAEQNWKLQLLPFVVFAVAISLKVYYIAIVWRCQQYFAYLKERANSVSRVALVSKRCRKMKRGRTPPPPYEECMR